MNIKKLLALVLALVLVLCATPMVFAGLEDSAESKDGDISADINDLPVNEEVIYGDVNGDEDVNTFDMLRLLDYLRDDSTAINIDNADVVPGGEIDTFDMLRLLDYLRDDSTLLGPAS